MKSQHEEVVRSLVAQCTHAVAQIIRDGVKVAVGEEAAKLGYPVQEVQAASTRSNKELCDLVVDSFRDIAEHWGFQMADPNNNELIIRLWMDGHARIRPMMNTAISIVDRICESESYDALYDCYGYLNSDPDDMI